MKKKKIRMMLFSIIAVLGLGFAQHDVMAATASEAGNDASIEIVEDWDPTPEPKPKPDPKPDPTPEPKPTPPKKTLTLPQTGEKSTSYLASGGLVMVIGVAAAMSFKKRKLTKE